MHGDADDHFSLRFPDQRKVPLAGRIEIVNRFIQLFEGKKEEFAKQLTEEMGRPIRYSAGEMGGFLERARYMVSIAETRLKDVELKDTDKEGFSRWIRREPMGVCVLISAWNVSGWSFDGLSLSSPPGADRPGCAASFQSKPDRLSLPIELADSPIFLLVILCFCFCPN